MPRFHRHHDSREIGFWGALAIGVGGMVGGGIFAVLGLAATLAGGATPIAFLIAGLVALLTAYSYVKLTNVYPREGGTIIFIDRAFGIDWFTGGINNLLWLSYVVTLSLYTVAFANYAETFLRQAAGPMVHHALISAGILIPLVLNLTSPSLISKTETAVVLIKIAILLLVVAFGVPSLDTARLRPAGWPPPLSIVGGGMLIFVAYEGFELIANTAPNVRNREKVLPRAYYSAVGFVMLLYIVIGAVVVGTLSPSEIDAAQDFALAQAAKPTLGQLGFTLVAVSAVLATFSAVNATLYGSGRLAASIAKEGELPKFLETRLWNQPFPGLVLTGGLALILANAADLRSISSLGSAGFLAIFGFVNAASFARHREARSSRLISALGVLACAVALGSLVAHTYRETPDQAWILYVLLFSGFVVEGIYGAARRMGLGG
jgi:hypothetical protein